MKKTFLILVFLSVSTFLLLAIPKIINAAVTPCDPMSGVPCTVCNPPADNPSGCVVDYNQSTCSQAGYYPDPAFCASFANLGTCPGSSGAKGNCLEAPSCKKAGESCTGIGQGTCCDNNPSLLCINGFCTQQATCIPSGEFCPGPAGTKGGCCTGLECNVWKVGQNTLKCQNPPNPITGYFCETSGLQCLPCHSGDTNSGCAPPQYSDYNSCHLACTGQVPLKFNCDLAQGGCVEAQNGLYNDIAACEANCSAVNAHLWCPGGEEKILNTAIGCIPVLTTKEAFLGFILKWAIGIGGGIAFLLIIYSGFMIMTAQGNPERLQAGKELMTSAISGLILLIFSIVILRIIGIDILGIPGFGTQ